MSAAVVALFALRGLTNGFALPLGFALVTRARPAAALVEETDGNFKDVTLDCAGVLTGWQPIGTSKYEYTRVDLVRHNFEKQGSCDSGRHENVSGVLFGLTVWGLGFQRYDAVRLAVRELGLSRWREPEIDQRDRDPAVPR